MKHIYTFLVGTSKQWTKQPYLFLLNVERGIFKLISLPRNLHSLMYLWEGSCRMLWITKDGYLDSKERQCIISKLPKWATLVMKCKSKKLSLNIFDRTSSKNDLIKVLKIIFLKDISPITWSEKIGCSLIIHSKTFTPW